MSTKEDAEKELNGAEGAINSEWGPYPDGARLHDVRAYIATLERQLAASYAPCKGCDLPPIVEVGTEDVDIYCDGCLHESHCIGEPTKALAAWNKLNRCG